MSWASERAQPLTARQHAVNGLVELLEDEVGCESAHQLEQIAQAWSDFERVFRYAVDRVLYESFDVHRFNAHIIGAYVTLEQRRSGYWGRQFKYDDIRILQLNTQRLREGMERGFCGAIDWQYRNRHKSEPRGDINNGGSLLHLQVW